MRYVFFLALLGGAVYWYYTQTSVRADFLITKSEATLSKLKAQQGEWNQESEKLTKAFKEDLLMAQSYFLKTPEKFKSELEKIDEQVKQMEAVVAERVQKKSDAVVKKAEDLKEQTEAHISEMIKDLKKSLLEAKNKMDVKAE